ncbi:N-6 DNA methylase [Burkholderia sp.]|uniref:N-6 DNA methylase n=1 Tax=Burkholderia sp. TaxID=36773 RepID=UPI00258638D2|nr:N-6 DNA methylase [Burkholderia sp.]MCA3805581.1 N-6 DNA methylase [Burkholderia sp.]
MPSTDLDAISDFPGLLTYLEEELDWPINEATFEEATFDFTAAELGLKEDAVGGPIEIKQLRKLTDNQPWGVFFLNLPHKRLPQTIVRNILGRLTVKKRQASNDPSRPAFLKSDLLFITSTGAGAERRLAFAHFQDDPLAGNAATLKILGWDGDDTPRRLALTKSTLAAKLHWPDNPADTEHWRAQWSAAFTRADTRTVVRDSKAMAKALAALGRRIRARAAELIEAQTADGSLVKLHAAFKEALIHDLKPAGFADTYAQTITYGLLSTAISRASGALTQDDMTANVAGTSPFLKEMLGQFIEAGGKKGGKAALDFDELGVGEVVELLRNADMAAVLADFDRKNPDEDPVIHFYELFLKEYDAEQKVKRGVFYTPRPVVSFIVRSVDEVLRTEFHLADGLASTATWGEVIAASAARGDEKPITLPAGAALADPFVRILDPATGTGTFLVECVDLIHKTMLAKWQAEKRSAAEIKALWNAYVPKHLLPRLTGFELMMAPYAIAHVKLGLKLSDTGYRFGSDARAQIYLTNALEPAQDLDMQLAFMSEALAHEAKAANDAKGTRFTVVVANPPYKGESANPSRYNVGPLKGKLTPAGELIEHFF